MYSLKFCIYGYFFCRQIGITYCVRHLKSWVHHSENVITVTRLQTNNVINDIIHLKKPKKPKQVCQIKRIQDREKVRNPCSSCRTSFSQLAFKVSKAIGLLGALLPGPGGMPPWSEDWLGQGKLNTCEPSFPRYRFTCCCWERWMWYLVGFSRWVWTCGRRKERQNVAPLLFVYCFRFISTVTYSKNCSSIKSRMSFFAVWGVFY